VEVGRACGMGRGELFNRIFPGHSSKADVPLGLRRTHGEWGDRQYTYLISRVRPPTCFTKNIPTILLTIIAFLSPSFPSKLGKAAVPDPTEFLV